MLSHYCKNDQQKRAFFLYCVCLLYILVKLFYYAAELTGYPDEPAHISYIIDLVKHRVLIPDLRSLSMYSYDHWASRSAGFSVTFTPIQNSINYLCHPPLYYQILSLSNSIRILEDGRAIVDVYRLRSFSIAFSSLAVVIAYWLGFSRLWKNGLLVNAAYAVAIATLPMLGYDCAGVNNDCLVFLGTMCYFAGVVRYEEGKRDQTTYTLIGIGFFICGLTKMTGLLILGVCTLVIVLLDIYKTRSVSIFWNKYFLRTIALYLVVIAYLVYNKCVYHVWQPSLRILDYEYFKATGFYILPENRVIMSSGEYVMYFWRRFWNSWSGIGGHNTAVNLAVNHKYNSFYGIIYTLPVWISAFFAVLQLVRRKCDYITVPVIASFFVAMVLQYKHAKYNFVSFGYLGSTQARYYLSLIALFAYIMCKNAVEVSINKKKLKILFQAIGLFLIVAWLSGDFIFLLKNITTLDLI